MGWVIIGNYIPSTTKQARANADDCRAVRPDENHSGERRGHPEASRPSHYIQGIVRESGIGNHALSTETNVNLNVYELDIGSDSVSLANTKDIHRLTTTIAGVQSATAFDFSRQTLASVPAAPSICNLSGVGLVLNSATIRIDGSLDATGVFKRSTVTTLADDATPSVSAGNLFKTGGTTTITDLDDGVVGQTVQILSEHAITIRDGTNIRLNGSENFVMAAGDVLVLTMYNDRVWVEDSRQVS